jgi:predicted nucleic acid-binding Zn ribbon protein
LASFVLQLLILKIGFYFYNTAIGCNSTTICRNMTTRSLLLVFPFFFLPLSKSDKLTFVLLILLLLLKNQRKNPGEGCTYIFTSFLFVLNSYCANVSFLLFQITTSALIPLSQLGFQFHSEGFICQHNVLIVETSTVCVIIIPSEEQFSTTREIVLLSLQQRQKRNKSMFYFLCCYLISLLLLSIYFRELF